MSPNTNPVAANKHTPTAFGPSDPVQVLILGALQNGALTLPQIVEQLQISEEEIKTNLERLQKGHMVHVPTAEDKLAENERHYRASAIKVIKESSAAKLLVHPVASQILNLLSSQMDNVEEKRRAMSLSEISKEIDLPKSKVNYHIARLMGEGLILKTRTESFRGLIRPFYQAKWKVNLPRLQSLRQSLRQQKRYRTDRVAESAYLELLNFFLWGWFMGKGFSAKKISDFLALQGQNEGKKSPYSNFLILIKIADVLEQLAGREEEHSLHGSPPSDELKFELIQKAVQQVLEAQDSGI
ncbi:MAG: ArsR family transcriptional regulator [Candidatus Heimdallarchaeota archaeon]